MNTHVRPVLTGAVEVRAPHGSQEPVEVTVIMVVYRTGPALAESVRRVLAEPLVGEFILIDNGSPPEDECVLDRARSDPRVNLVRGHGNVGFARACNMGSKLAHGRVLIVLNPDAFIQPGCVAELVSALEDRPAPCIVGARVLNPDGTEQRGARRGEITPVTALLTLTRLSHTLRAFRRFEVHHETDPLARGGPEAVPTISGACFAMRAVDYAFLDGFDEGYFLHVEDVDLCWRARQAGGVVLFDPDAEVIHLGSTSRTLPIIVEYWKGVGLARYFRKRADNSCRRLLAQALGPLIIAVSVARPILRGQLFRR